MATTIQTIIDRAREDFNEPTASFWTDAKLLNHAQNAIRDLWKAVKDVVQDHFFTVSTAASIAASTSTVSSVPTDIAEIRLIEPSDLTTYPNLVFRPLAYNHPDFQNARAMGAQDPGSVGCIFYAITGAGAPVGAPTIYIAPLISSAVTLRIMYVPTIGTLALGDNNPIPGESDHAVECWIVAHALGKQAADGTFQPDAGWLEKYEAEKARVVTAITPRQTQEPTFAEAVFEPYW